LTPVSSSVYILKQTFGSTRTFERLNRVPHSRTLWSNLYSLAFVWLAGSQSIAQTYIDIDSAIVKVEYDGKVAKTVKLEASLVYGFAYSVPMQIAVAEGVELSSLHGSSICNCVSFSIKNGHVMNPDAPGKGFLLIRPKSEDLYQAIDIMGTRAGEVEPVLVAKIKLSCEVYHPVRVSPAIIEVRDGRLLTTELRVEPTEGVTISDVQIVDSNSLLDFAFDAKSQRVSIAEHELPKGTDAGQIALRFNLLFMGQKKQHEAIVAYEPRKPLRLIPKTLTFREVDKKYEAQFVVIGFSLSQSEAPRFLIEQENELGHWNLIDADVRISSFGFGKAVGKLSVEQNSVEFEKDKLLKFRFRSEDESFVLEDIRAVLVR
jgi:hypothetical protein